ncbi:MAG: DNA-binding protein [Gemmatimonadaceae bacterium]|nr:DNA-binding protein [Gemmatimonadaceae bacterium]
MTYTRTSSVLLASVASTLFAGQVAAQGTTPPRGRGAGAAANMPRYDVSTVMTIEGTLIAVDTVKSMAGIQGTGLHATLKTTAGTFPLNVGPTMYITTQRPALAKGDKVKVTGSKVTIYTVPTILAASVVKGTDTLRLRDANGMPMWRGMRRPQ